MISNFKFSRGFTLIELIVVLTIGSIISMLAIAGFSTYNQIQVLQTSASDLGSTLGLARSRASSQIKNGTNCSNQSNSLDSYTVSITIPGSYNLTIQCSSGSNSYSDSIYSKTLSSGIVFTNDTSPVSYVFPTVKGGINLGGQIVLKDNNNPSRTKTITVSSAGGISIR